MNYQKELFIHTRKGNQFLIQREVLTGAEVVGVASNDHLFTDEVLRKLHSINQEYSIVYTGAGFGIIRERAGGCADLAEIHIMKRSAFHAWYCNQRVTMQEKGKTIHLTLSEAWLKWSGKRVSALQCLGKCPFYVEGRTVAGDSRYFDKTTYECGDNLKVSSRFTRRKFTSSDKDAHKYCQCKTTNRHRTQCVIPQSFKQSAVLCFR
ncbi:hypothetical protein [Desulforhopalus sp. IMCC35007]|uniref:hypothetical protein n=1 Tax=Desulforhopalus sp. IMCC35007 TaxID=2569543 RepID=UPI0010AE23EA|nr:hypothetical protein [Desulforhopalus sp. IMCC35007]TKB07445.1 hypothetical protein FCL48_17035 [Desulforhopalus sp. IMCC35007]